MQVNNQYFKGYNNAKRLITPLLFIVAGAAFLAIGIYVLLNPSPEEANPYLMPILFMVAGSITMISSLISFISILISIKNFVPLTEGEIYKNEEAFNKMMPELENIKDTQLYFHFAGKLNQSFVLEDKEGHLYYECILKKFHLFLPSTYEFIDHVNHHSRLIKIGKTVTVGDHHVVYSSSFKIDGVNCWEFLRRLGYEIKQYLLDGHTINRFDLVKLNEVVASIYFADIKDPWNNNSRHFLRMGYGAFRIEIIDSRLNDVVFAAFILSHVSLVQ